MQGRDKTCRAARFIGLRWAAEPGQQVCVMAGNDFSNQRFHGQLVGYFAAIYLTKVGFDAPAEEVVEPSRDAQWQRITQHRIGIPAGNPLTAQAVALGQCNKCSADGTGPRRAVFHDMIGLIV